MNSSEMTELPVANSDLRSRLLASHADLAHEDSAAIREQVLLLGEEMMEDVGPFGKCEARHVETDDLIVLLSEEKFLWFLLRILGMRPWSPNTSVRYYFALNVLLWAGAIFSFVTICRTVSHMDVEISGKIGASIYLILTVLSLSLHMLNGPISHGLVIRFFYYRNQVLTPLEEMHAQRYRKSIPATDFEESGDATALRPKSNTLLSPDLKDAASNVLRPVRTTAFNRDSKIVVIALFCCTFVLTPGVVFAHASQLPVDDEVTRVLLVMFAMISNVITFTAFALFCLLARVCHRQVLHYLKMVEQGQFRNGEEMFAFHLSLRAFFNKTLHDFRTFCAILFVISTVYVLTLMAWIYSGTIPYVTSNPVLLAIYFTVVGTNMTLYVSLLVWALSSINDAHYTLRNTIVSHQLFTITERVLLLTEIDMFPVSLEVFGFLLSSAAFQKMGASIVVAIIPAISKAAFT